MASVGVFNRLSSTSDGEVASYVRYSQLSVDQWKTYPGNSELTDAEAFEEIVSSVAANAEYAIIGESELPDSYYLAAAYYDFETEAFVINQDVLLADINSAVLISANGIRAHIEGVSDDTVNDMMCSCAIDDTVPPTFADQKTALDTWEAAVWDFCYNEFKVWQEGDAMITATDLINDPGFPVLTLP